MSAQSVASIENVDSLVESEKIIIRSLLELFEVDDCSTIKSKFDLLRNS